MVEQLPALVVTTPLLFSFLIFLVGLFEERTSYPLFFTCLTLNLAFCLALFFKVMKGGTISYHLGGWQPPWGIEYRVDALNGLVLACIGVVSWFLGLCLNHVVKEEFAPERRSQLYTLLSLQICGLCGIVVTGDLFNLYVLLEIASFSAYAIVAMGKKGAEFSAFRYLVFGTIGACFYLLGVGHLYILTGSLNLEHVKELLQATPLSKALTVGFLFLMVGIGVKMALFPLHFWLPDAYSMAPSSVSIMLAPLSTKVASYVALRILFDLFFKTQHTEAVQVFLKFSGWVVSFGIFFSAFMAMAQKELRRTLSYFLISEICFLTAGIASFTRDGLRGAVLHLVNDMFMMGCLFASISLLGLLKKREDTEALDNLSDLGLFPGLSILFGMLSVIGVPPFCGFFSKWYLVLGALESKSWHMAIALLVGSLLNAVVVFKWLEKAFLKGTHHEKEENRGKALELWGFKVGLFGFCAFLVFLGLYTRVTIEVIDLWIGF